MSIIKRLPGGGYVIEAANVADDNIPAAVDPKAGGVKHDSSKVRLELLSMIALIEIGKVATFGAAKYDDNNWRKGFKWSRLLGAALRHLFAFIGGEDKDPESGLSHLAHAGCCILFLLEHEVTHKELDDRYKGNIQSLTGNETVTKKEN